MKIETSLIITKEKPQLLERLIYFEIDGYYIIPVKADFLQFHFISKHEYAYQPLGFIFKSVTDEIYYTENLHPKPVFCDLDNLESLLLIELVYRLNIREFLLYHHSRTGDSEYTYTNHYQSGLFDYYAVENEEDEFKELFQNPKFNLNDYLDYDSCKQKFVKEKEG